MEIKKTLHLWLYFFLFCRMYRSHFYSPLMTLPHSLHVFTGKKNLKMSTFGMETEMNKWCFIKIFSKNTIAPQLWTSSVLSTVWLADKLTIRTKKKKKEEKKKTVETPLRTSLWFVCKCLDFAIEITVWKTCGKV